MLDLFIKIYDYFEKHVKTTQDDTCTTKNCLYNFDGYCGTCVVRPRICEHRNTELKYRFTFE